MKSRNGAVNRRNTIGMFMVFHHIMHVLVCVSLTAKTGTKKTKSLATSPCVYLAPLPKMSESVGGLVDETDCSDR